MLFPLSTALAASFLFLSVSAGAYRLCCCTGEITDNFIEKYGCDETVTSGIANASSKKWKMSPHYWYSGDGTPWEGRGYVRTNSRLFRPLLTRCATLDVCNYWYGRRCEGRWISRE